ncbi:MAG: amidohydrolase family protein [Acidimicrobiia bacterium]
MARVGSDRARSPESPDESPDERLDATGCVVVPGLVNAHHHLLQSAFRTGPDTRHVPMSDWLVAMRRRYDATGVDAALAAAAAAVGLAESMLCGVTTVADHHLTWPDSVDACTEIAAATVGAARRLGARLVFVRGSAADDPNVAAASAEALCRVIEPDAMVQLAVGPAGVHSDRRETFEAFADVARRYGLRRRTQANEQVDVAIALDRYGRRPIDLLEEWGWLDTDVTLAHLCAVTDDEIARLAERGVTATHAPGCDLPQGWGVSPVAALRRAGIAVGLGTSGGGSNDAGHLLADARLAMQIAPLAGGASSTSGSSRALTAALTARDVLTMATRGSSLGLGRDDLGCIEPGKAADLCCYDMSGVSDAGVEDRLAALVWTSPGRRPRHVVVGGRVVVRDHRLVTDDEATIAADLMDLLGSRRKEYLNV